MTLSGIGRVISRYKNSCLVQFKKSIIKLSFPKKQTKVYAGDWVSFELDYSDSSNQPHQTHQSNQLCQLESSIKLGYQGQLLKVQEPKQTFFRQDSYGNKKIIARNCTQLALVLAFKPKVNFLTIDSTLALSQLNQIKPLIVINKSDLSGSQSFFEGLSRYQNLGVEIIFCSTYKSENLEVLKAKLKHQTTLFFGMSGVGKSSIIQSFFPEQKLLINDLVTKTGLGKHTTTQAQLYQAEDYELIDTAGMGNETISYFESKTLDSLFVDFYPYISQCKYRNCLHTSTNASCAVIEASNQGLIHPKRLVYYQRLLADYCFDHSNKR